MNHSSDCSWARPRLRQSIPAVLKGGISDLCCFSSAMAAPLENAGRAVGSRQNNSKLFLIKDSYCQRESTMAVAFVWEKCKSVRHCWAVVSHISKHNGKKIQILKADIWQPLEIMLIMEWENVKGVLQVHKTKQNIYSETNMAKMQCWFTLLSFTKSCICGNKISQLFMQTSKKLWCLVNKQLSRRRCYKCGCSTFVSSFSFWRPLRNFTVNFTLSPCWHPNKSRKRQKSNRAAENPWQFSAGSAP